MCELFYILQAHYVGVNTAPFFREKRRPKKATCHFASGAFPSIAGRRKGQEQVFSPRFSQCRETLRPPLRLGRR